MGWWVRGPPSLARGIGQSASTSKQLHSLVYPTNGPLEPVLRTSREWAGEASGRSHLYPLASSVKSQGLVSTLTPSVCTAPAHLPGQAAHSRLQSQLQPLLMLFPLAWMASPQKSMRTHFRCHLTKGAPPPQPLWVPTSLSCTPGGFSSVRPQGGARLPLQEGSGCPINADD